jgi:AcrR family transcriptional regulator
MAAAQRSRRGAPGRARVPRDKREPEMLRAAAEVFGERGFHAASMDEIASRAGISKPMLYSYFGSKDGLFAACGEAAVGLLRQQLRDSADRQDLPADQRLWRGLVGVFSFIGEHRNLWFVFTAPAGAGAPQEAGEVGARGHAAINTLMEELLSSSAVMEGVAPEAASQVAPLAHALTASVLAMAEWWLAHPDESPELQALRVMNFAWTGFEQMLDGKLWLPAE